MMRDDADFVLDDLIEEFPRLFEDADLAPLMSLWTDDADELIPPGAQSLVLETAR
jgi:hypothetical protein